MNLKRKPANLTFFKHIINVIFIADVCSNNLKEITSRSAIIVKLMDVCAI